MSEDESILYGFRNRAGDREAAAEAEESFRRGSKAQGEGRLDEAAEHYRRSIKLFPTAEAHTFLGWVFSFQGRAPEAIEECKRAIEVDPDFGNPYNDIGAYLIELGRLDEAVPWLEKAKRAGRYEPRHFPHVNLARIHILKDRPLDAVRELKQSLEYHPGNSSALGEIRRLIARFN